MPLSLEDAYKIAKQFEKMLSGKKEMHDIADHIETLSKHSIPIDVLRKTRIEIILNDLRRKIKDEKLAKKAKHLVYDWRDILESKKHSSRTYNLDKDRIKKEELEERSIKREESEERCYKGEERNIRREKREDRYDKFYSRSDKFADFRNRDSHSRNKNEEKIEEEEKEKPCFVTSGKLLEDTNMFKGVIIKYNEPPEAKIPKARWRLYPFKGKEDLPVIYIHRQSAYLIGRDRKIADFPIDHPSCSKQHAALQYRSMTFSREDGTQGRRTLPYIIDLGSGNGTFLNNEKLEAQRYYELKVRDILKFGFSSREYVVVKELSDDKRDDDKDSDEDDVDIIDRAGLEDIEEEVNTVNYF